MSGKTHPTRVPRAHCKTTLTSLLHALTLASLASRLGNEAAPAFASHTTMDMRRYEDGKLPA